MLSKIRLAIIRYKLGALLAIFFFIVSCSDEITSRDKNTATSAYAAEDYFRAIYFIDGPLAPALGDYQQLSFTSFTTDEQAIKEVREFQQQVTAYIGKNHPSFFNEFKRKITSGDYSIVKAAIKDGTKEYLEAMKALSESRISENETSDIVQKYLAKYGNKKNISKSELVANIKDFSKERIDDESAKVEMPADEVAEKRMVSVEQYFWLYIDAAAAVVVIIVIVLAAEDNPAPALLSADNTYLFEDYAATITTGLALE